MNTPICDFVDKYAAADPARLHMPGHKGAGMLERLDITEIPGADVLYHPTGIILESERNAARLFGTRRTVYSAEGSSLCIRAMLYLAAQYAAAKGKAPRIAAGRNAHKVFITAAALLHMDVDWLWPEEGEGLLSCSVTPDRLETFLQSREPPVAVYITSPDYLGNMADIRSLSRVCHAHGCLLLVDNAHGAYLNFLPVSCHPMALGADLCCDSAHKTLPVLTGGAYLHISETAPAMLEEMADSAMALFASTSPSYLILQSLDRANAALANLWPEKLRRAELVWTELKAKLCALGLKTAGQEPLKITLMPKSYGYTGEELAEKMEKAGLYCEFADPDYLVMMLPVEFPSELPGRIEAFFEKLERKPPILLRPPRLERAEKVLPAHRVLFLPSKTVETRHAAGHIMADSTVSCPPAIPVVCAGERIVPWAVRAMEYYGITHVRVLPQDAQ